MLGTKLRFGAFIAPFHPIDENPTLAIQRDLELVQWMDQLGYEEAWIGEHHSTGWEMIASPELFLAAVGERHPEEFIVMVMDQAGWHIASQLQVPPDMRLVLLPPYSPELNPAEHLWEALREDWFANTVFDDLDAVEDALNDGLCALESDPERVRRMTGFDWIISISKNAN